jgi:hypothetical protein
MKNSNSGRGYLQEEAELAFQIQVGERESCAAIDVSISRR